MGYASISKREAEYAVQAVFATITQELVKGEKVNIAGFGIFIAKQRHARMGINPRRERGFKSPPP